MQVIPYVTETRDVRVIDSKIGKVMPISDIAKVLDYDNSNLMKMIDRNAELFDGTVEVVTTTTVQDNRGTEQVRNYEVKALNHYGVFGLLMKLDYNRIQDEEKKANVIRFQRWAMEVLGDRVKGSSAKAKKLTRSNTGHYNHVINTLPELPEGVEYYTKPQVAEKLGMSQRSAYRHVIKGYIPAFKRFNYYKHWEYAFMKSDIDAIVERKARKESK